MQKEVKVKLLTESVNNFIAKAPPAAHEALKKELDVLTNNYQRLCSRLNGKCKTLEVSSFSVYIGMVQIYYELCVCKTVAMFSYIC